MASKMAESYKRAAEKQKLLKERMLAHTPTTFRGAMAQVRTISVNSMDALVYSTPGKKSGRLRDAERVRKVADGHYQLANDAASEWNGTKTYYAWPIAKGRKAANKGQKYFAWMKNAYDPRPTTWQGWVDARNQGRAVLTHKIRAVPARNWRQAAVKMVKASGAVVKQFRKQQEASNKAAGSI